MLKNKYILTLVCALFSIVNFAQTKNKYCIYHQVAVEKYSEKNLDDAKTYIDSALLMCESLKQDPYVHHIKGFIYYELFKRDEKEQMESPLRDSALAAFLASNKYDLNKEFQVKNNKSIKNIATRIQYNVANNLDTIHYLKAIELNALYKRTLAKGGIIINNREYDISYYNSLGSIYTDLYENNKSANASMIDTSIAFYEKGLAIDSLNFVGNLQLGYVYHNLSIDIILNMDPEDDIMTMYENQEKSSTYGLKSLPYLKIAHEMEPKNRDVLYGLAGIYFMLQEKEKSDFYQNLYNELSNGEGSGQTPINDN